MDLEAIGSFIQSVGFPIAVSAFLLVRMNGKFDRLADAVRENTEATKELTKRQRGREA